MIIARICLMAVLSLAFTTPAAVHAQNGGYSAKAQVVKDAASVEKKPSIDVKLNSVEARHTLETNAMSAFQASHMRVLMGIKVEDASGLLVGSGAITAATARTDAGEQLIATQDSDYSSSDGLYQRLMGYDYSDGYRTYSMAFKPLVMQASRITQANAQFSLDIGVGVTKEQSLDDLPFETACQMTLPEDPVTPIAFTRSSVDKLIQQRFPEAVQTIEIQMNSYWRKRLVRLFFYDGVGNQLAIKGMQHPDATGRFNVQVKDTPNVSVKLVYYDTIMKYTWALKLTELPLPMFAAKGLKSEVTAELLSVEPSH